MKTVISHKFGKDHRFSRYGVELEVDFANLRKYDYYNSTILSDTGFTSTGKLVKRDFYVINGWQVRHSDLVSDAMADIRKAITSQFVITI